MCRAAKEEWISKQCKDIEIMALKHQHKNMHKQVLQLSNKRKSMPGGGCLKNKKGNIIMDNDEIIHRWTEYVEELFQDNRKHKPHIENQEGPEIIKSEVERAIKMMKRNKSSGPDNIQIEMIKALEEFGIDTITDLCNEMHKTGYIPKDLKTSVFITLPKKPKAIDCTDYRTISLMSHVTKILLKIIKERIENRINNELDEEQFGFRKHSGTREAILSLRILTEKYIEVQKCIYVCFIDYKKAFDSVQHEKLVECIQEVNLDGKDIQLIRNLYWEQSATVRIGHRNTPEIEIQKGVRQGCVLSPCLFNIYTEVIFKHIKGKPGVKINGRIINNLRYADDTVLMAESEQELQELVDEVYYKSNQYGLDMNIQKTKAMIIGKTLDKPAIKIQINGRILEQVKSYVYLGHTITEDGKCDMEIRKRIGMAKSTFINMKSILTSKQITNKLKMRIARCYVYSILLYGSESWTLNKMMEDKINAFEMWVYRRIGHISWKEKKTNKAVLEMLGMKQDLLKEVKTRQLKYFGHLKRHDSLLKNILEGRVEGKRARGGQRYMWENNIKRWTGNSMTECTNGTRDRQRWRSIVANLRCGDGT
jgi:hypothetical protein